MQQLKGNFRRTHATQPRVVDHDLSAFIDADANTREPVHVDGRAHAQAHTVDDLQRAAGNSCALEEDVGDLDGLNIPSPARFGSFGS